MSFAHRPMTDDEAQTFLAILLINKKDPQAFALVYPEMRENSFILSVLEKRIEAFQLPLFEKSALLALELFAQGNPGRAVLSLIDTMEAYQKYLPEKIDISFISTFVYPDGPYSQAGFETVWEDRKNGIKVCGYNRMI